MPCEMHASTAEMREAWASECGAGVAVPVSSEAADDGAGLGSATGSSNGGLEHGEKLGFGDGFEALFLELALHGGVLGHVADRADHAEVERGGGQAETGTVGGEGVLERGGCCVSGLGGVAKGADR